MKNSHLFILICIGLLLSLNLESQEDNISGQFVIGGTFNLTAQTNAYPFSTISISSGLTGIGGIFSNTTNDSKNQLILFTPYFGKELNAHFMIGLNLDFRTGRYETTTFPIVSQPDEIELERKSNQFGFGLFTRHMFNPQNDFKLFIQPYLLYQQLSEDEYWDGELAREEKANYFDLGLRVGALYQITDVFRITLQAAGINYINGNWEVIDTDIESDFNSINTSLDLASLLFGVELTF